jgi:hypothetical protein
VFRSRIAPKDINDAESGLFPLRNRRKDSWSHKQPAIGDDGSNVGPLTPTSVEITADRRRLLNMPQRHPVFQAVLVGSPSKVQSKLRHLSPGSKGR